MLKIGSIKHGDWNSVRQAIQRITVELGTLATPKFAGIDISTGELTVGSINRASGTLTLEIGGTSEIAITSTATTFGGNIIIPNSGTIGSVSDTDVMTIDASGNTTFSVFPITPSAAPDANYEVSNKKYVDDKVGAGGHTHDTDILQLDGVNSDGGAFSFTTTGAVTFNQSIVASGLDLTGITNNNIPYVAASGFADSPLTTDGTDVTILNTFDGSSGKIRVTDNATAIPSGESDGYLGVSQVAGEARIYFVVEGVTYYCAAVVPAVSPTTGNPMGMFPLTITYP